jgi:cytochrome P450
MAANFLDSVNIFGISREAHIFGSDSDIFRPERWLEATKDRVSFMERVLDGLVFSYGRFRCLGQPVAMMEFNKLFPEILRRFDLTVLNIERPIKSRSHGVWLHSNFFVRAVDRVDTLY